MNRSLTELINEAKELGLEVPECCGKREIISLLRGYYLSEQPHSEVRDLYLSRVQSPMLCGVYDKLKPDLQDEIIDEYRWCVEEKLDGNRMLICWLPESNEFQLYSRNISVKDYLPVSYGDHLDMGAVDMTRCRHSFIIDTEVVAEAKSVNARVVTQTQLQTTTAILALNPEDSKKAQKEVPLRFWVFDILYCDGVWLTEEALWKRRKVLDNVFQDIVDTGLNVTLLSYFMGSREEKEEVFKAIVEKGGEGVVYKNLTSTYNLTGSRVAGWVKRKRRLSGAHSQQDIDAYVTGFIPGKNGFEGLVGALIFSSQILRKDGSIYEKEIARVSNIPLEVRREISVLDSNGELTLRQDVFGKVATLDGVGISVRSKRMTHAHLMVWRPDKSWDSCVLEDEFLETQIGTTVQSSNK